MGNTIPVETAALLVAQRGQGDAEDPHQLMNFLNKGGKVIWYHGGSDPLITPFRSTWYYEQLASLLGGYGPTQNSVRLFIEPGMGHCGGGVSPNSFDTLQALDYWVTKGVAPEGIARDGADDDVAVLRPDDAALQIPGGGELFGLGQRLLSGQLVLQSQRHAHVGGRRHW